MPPIKLTGGPKNSLKHATSITEPQHRKDPQKEEA